MKFEFLKKGLIPPRPVGREKKETKPVEKIWNRYLKISQETIDNSIKEWEGYINKPEARADQYYAAKNWTILNREQFYKGHPAEVSCSMTVGRITKFRIIPKFYWEGKGENRVLLVDESIRVGTIVQRQHNVLATLLNFQKILLNLVKESQEGEIFWQQAIAVAKPRSKKNWSYDGDQDLWLARM